MIFGIYNPPKIKIRNHSLNYWFRHLNTKITIINSQGTKKVKKGVGILFFNPETFIRNPDDFVYLFSKKPTDITAYTLNQQILFWWIPTEIFSDKQLDYQKLKSIRSKKIEIDPQVEVIDISKDIRQLEDEIVNLQVKYYLKKQVIFEDLRNFFIDGLLKIGKNTQISYGVSLKGKESQIGDQTIIYPNVYIENSKVGNNCVILPGSIIKDSTLQNSVTIGPYAHLRNDVLIKANAKVGSFVEMKKTIFGNHSKAMHFSYIGDASIGKGVNIGAGTITCNYDGEKKHKTTIGDKAFIGSGSQLVAPIKINTESYIGAGSTLTDDVPAQALALSRGRQKNKLNWVKKKKKD